MEYSITFKNQLKATGTTIWVIMFLMFGIYYLKESSGTVYPNVVVNTALIGLIIILPGIYLHIEYFLISRNKKIEIDISKGLIYVNEGLDLCETYKFMHLEKIDVYMAPSWHRKWDKIQYLPFEQYHYARIYTKNGKEIIFTCLLAENVEDALSEIKGVSIERKKRIFASILMK